MLDPDQFRSHVIRPTLATIGLQSRAAECLLLGTALVESGLTALVQKGRGPALGVYQVEPGTHTDIWKNYLAFRPALALKVAKLRVLPNPGHGQLVWNLGYATAVARLVYLRWPEPLPAADDLAGLARYWKVYFNTSSDKISAKDFIARAGPYLRASAKGNTA